MTLRERFRDCRLAYQEIRDMNHSRLDAFLMAYGLWVYFPHRYPRQDDD